MKTINTTYINLAKRLAAIVLLGTIGIGVLQAGTDYEIIFRNCAEDESYSVPQYTLDKILSYDTYYKADYIASIDEARNVYNAQHGTYQGVRIGNQDHTGSLIMTFSDKCQINASKIVFRMAQYFGHDYGQSDEGDMRVTITYTDNSTSVKTHNPINLEGEMDTNTSECIMILIPEKKIKSIRFETLKVDHGRAYCQRFKIYSAPIVTQPTVTDITKTSATLTSKVTDLGSERTKINKGYGFVISSTNTVPTKSDCEKSIRVGETYTTLNHPFSIDLTDLTPGTTYYTRAYVSKDDTENGWDSYSALTTTFNTIGHRATFNVGEEGYGSCEITSLEEFPNTAGITLPVVTVDPNCGYRFLGWATTSGATTADAGNAGDIYNLESDIIFYAVYIQQFTVQWLIDGKPTTSNSPTTIVDEGSKVTQLPSPPPPADQCGQAFVGWTSTPITATQTSPPTPLFTTIEESPQINENTTFYAVFADIEQ